MQPSHVIYSIYEESNFGYVYSRQMLGILKNSCLRLQASFAMAYGLRSLEIIEII